MIGSWCDTEPRNVAMPQQDEQDCEQAVMDVNGVSFKSFQKSALQMFYEEESAFNTFYQGLEDPHNAFWWECKHNFTLKNSTGLWFTYFVLCSGTETHSLWLTL